MLRNDCVEYFFVMNSSICLQCGPIKIRDRKGEPSLRANPFGPCWGHSICFLWSCSCSNKLYPTCCSYGDRGWCGHGGGCSCSSYWKTTGITQEQGPPALRHSLNDLIDSKALKIVGCILFHNYLEEWRLYFTQVEPPRSWYQPWLADYVCTSLHEGKHVKI